MLPKAVSRSGGSIPGETYITNARVRNVGWRWTFYGSENLMPRVKDVVIHDQILPYGVRPLPVYHFLD